MRFALFPFAAGLASAHRWPTGPAKETKVPRGTASPDCPMIRRGSKEVRVIPAASGYSASLFMCDMEDKPEGNCCESVTSNNLGVNCDHAAPLMANYMSKTSLFDCSVTIAGMMQKKAVAACCSKNYTMVTPSMALYHCRHSEMLNIQVSSQNPDVVEQFIDTIDA